MMQEVQVLKTASALILLTACHGQEVLSRSLELQRAAIGKQRAMLTMRPESKAQERQRASVRRQAMKASPERVSASGFYTVPWPDPPVTPVKEVGAASPCFPLKPEDLFEVTGHASTQTGIAQEILNAVIGQESAGLPCAVSPKGALGLMQLMPGTAEELGVENALDPVENVMGGSRFLKGLLDRYSGDLTLALAAYNAGPGRVDRAHGMPGIPETQDYVRSILRRIRLEAPRLTEIPSWPPPPSSEPRAARSEQK